MFRGREFRDFRVTRSVIHRAIPEWVSDLAAPSDGTLPLLAADYGSDRYWFNGSAYSSLSAFHAAVKNVDFARTSEATYFDSNGILQTAAADVLRTTYDPATGEGRGVLIEGARTNEALYNRDLTNAAWSKTDCTASKDQEGIDGESNAASSLTATGSNATCLQTVTLAESERSTSAYVKRLSGSGTVEMTTDGGSSWIDVTSDIDGSGPNGYARVSIPAQTVTDPEFGFRIATSGDSIAVDYFHNEDGAFPSSPTETEGSSVTRTADSYTVGPNGDNRPFEGFPVNGPFTVMLSGRSALGISGSQFLVTLSDDEGENRIEVRRANESDTSIRARFNGSNFTTSIDTIANNIDFQLALRVEDNDLACSLDGGTSVKDETAPFPPGLEQLVVGSWFNLNNPAFSTIKQIAIYPSGLPDSDLETLSGA